MASRISRRLSGICLLLAVSMAAHAQQVELTKKPAPRRILYFMFLRQLSWYYNDANAAKINPNNPNQAKYAFEVAIGMSDADYTTLAQIASTCVANVFQQDAAAKLLIDSVHAQTPGGLLAKGQAPPPIPPELMQMQTNRDNIMDACVSSVQSGVPQSFPAIDNYVMNVFGLQATATTVPTPGVTGKTARRSAN